MYEQNLIDAMSLIVDSSIQKLKFDKTIQATIFEIVDKETAEYRVKYAGNIFSAFSNDLTYEYKVGDSVYVKIPEGDFTNKKFIENKVSSRTAPIQGVLPDQIINLTPPVIEFNPTWEMGVKSQKGNDSVSFSDLIINDDSIDIFSSLKVDRLDSFSKIYKTFQIKAKITTKFKEPFPHKGNYGIRVIFNTNKETTADFVLDTSSFIGNYYENMLEFEQSAEFAINEDIILTGLKDIEVFCEDFEEIENNSQPVDIILNGFSMAFIKVVDLNNVPYYLTITAPYGNDKTTTRLKAIFLVNGSLATDNDYTIQWYKQNLKITAGVEGYDRIAGYTWEKIVEDADSLEYVAKREEYDCKYKAIVTYRKTTTIGAEFTVAGIAPKDLSLNQIGSKLKIISDTIAESVLNNYYYTWYVSMSNGSYSRVTDRAKGNKEIDISQYLIYTGVILYCIVEDNNKIIAYLNSVGAKEELFGDVDVSFEGEDLYNYDANGDIKIEEAELDRTIFARIDWGQEYIPDYSIIWVTPDGQELDKYGQTSSHSPKDSMMKNMWQDLDGVLHYNLNMKFNPSYNKNIIGMQLINRETNVTYLFRKEITFIKDGDQGTNGTTFAAKIVYFNGNDKEEKELTGFNGLDYSKTIAQSTKYLKAVVYKNGIEQNPADWTFKWTGVNVKITSDNSYKISIQRDADNTYELDHYLRVEISNNETTLAPHFPIDVYKGISNTNKVDTSLLPKSIIYSSSGTNPQYYAKPLTYSYDGIEGKDFNDISGFTSILRKFTREGESLVYLNPPAKLGLMNEKMGVYKLTCGSGNIIHTTLMYINTYGNEAINGWDGISISINEEKKTILAPQVGAGKKNNDNTFTGVIMGEVSDASYGSNGNKVYGLYGYKNGKNTFYFDENGDGYLEGKINAGSGTIGGWSIDDDSIYSASGSSSAIASDNAKISTKDFSRSINNKSPNDLRFAIGNSFAVSKNGKLYANNADISGTINADYGSIGGWTITPEGLSKGSVSLGSDGTISGATITGGSISGATITGMTVSADQLLISGQPAQTETIKDYYYISGPVASIYNEEYWLGFEVQYRELTIPCLENVWGGGRQFIPITRSTLNLTAGGIQLNE